MAQERINEGLSHFRDEWPLRALLSTLAKGGGARHPLGRAEAQKLPLVSIAEIGVELRKSAQKRGTIQETDRLLPSPKSLRRLLRCREVFTVRGLALLYDSVLQLARVNSGYAHRKPGDYLEPLPSHKTNRRTLAPLGCASKLIPYLARPAKWLSRNPLRPQVQRR